jgi:hypothetical protein
VWPLSSLAAHLGQEAWDRLWRAMLKATALVFSSALPRAIEASICTFHGVLLWQWCTSHAHRD